MKTAFVSIRQGQWSVSVNEDQPDVTFPISGKGMKSFFQTHKVRDVLCSSSVDFPRDGGAKISGNKARDILTKTLSW